MLLPILRIIITQTKNKNLKWRYKNEKALSVFLKIFHSLAKAKDYDLLCNKKYF